MAQALADAMRPRTFDEMIGQERLVGPDGVIRRMATTGHASSLILSGPSGTGKTTAALILADSLSRTFVHLNGTDFSVTDVKAAAKAAPALLCLDEIQYLNKKQQQTFLPYVESGDILLVATTTDNPYHSVYGALRSRCLILEFKPLTQTDLENTIRRATENLSAAVSDSVVTTIATRAAGDARQALTLLEFALAQADGKPVTDDMLGSVVPSLEFDQAADAHYAYVSAFQKSIRGSDPDAAVFWLMRLLVGGDIQSPSRRLLVIACEDIGLADPNAITLTLSCVTAAERLGMPEAAKPLTQATIYLALAQKSASIEPAYQGAQVDIETGRGLAVPAHIAEEHAPGYVWPHALPFQWANQQYLPDDLIGKTYYTPSDAPAEKVPYEYWESVRAYVRQQKGCAG